MRKSFGFYALFWAILLGLFNLIAFISTGWTGIEKYTPSFWIGYAVISAAFLGNLILSAFALLPKNKDKMFLRFPLIKISYSCLIMMFIVGGLCMLISPMYYLIGIIICPCIFVLYLISAVKAMTAAVVIDTVGETVKKHTQFIKLATADAQNILNRAQTEASKAACKKVYDALRYADPMSNDALSAEEAKITAKLDELTDAVNTSADKIDEIAEEIVRLVNARNNKCKAMK